MHKTLFLRKRLIGIMSFTLLISITGILSLIILIMPDKYGILAGRALIQYTPPRILQLAATHLYLPALMQPFLKIFQHKDILMGKK